MGPSFHLRRAKSNRVFVFERSMTSKQFVDAGERV